MCVLLFELGVVLVVFVFVAWFCELCSLCRLYCCVGSCCLDAFVHVIRFVCLCVVVVCCCCWLFVVWLLVVVSGVVV